MSAETVHPRGSPDREEEPATQRPRLAPQSAPAPDRAATTPADVAGQEPASQSQASQEEPRSSQLASPSLPGSVAGGPSPAAALAVTEAAAATGADQQGFGDAAGVGREGDGLISAVNDGNQKMEEHFQPSIPMQEMVVNFLLRMAFVIGGDKEQELQVRSSFGIDKLSAVLFSYQPFRQAHC